VSRQHVLLKLRTRGDGVDIYSALDLDNYQAGYEFEIAEVRVDKRTADAEILPRGPWASFQSVKSAALLRERLKAGEPTHSVIPYGGRAFVNLLSAIGVVLESNEPPTN
jgi:hypothetical protein